jgi:hypothetical protein
MDYRVQAELPPNFSQILTSLHPRPQSEFAQRPGAQGEAVSSGMGVGMPRPKFSQR